MLNGFKEVILLPDHYEPGQHYVHDVSLALMSLSSSPEIKMLLLSGLPEGGDVVDWLQNHAPDWDGLQPFPANAQAWAMSEFRRETYKSQPIPKKWGIAGLVGPNSSVFEWEKPNEIITKTPAVNVMRIEMIPEPLRPWLDDVSFRMQTPPDFSTVSALVIIGSIIGAGCAIRPKRVDDWEVIPNVWGACIGRPSVVLKTPSMKEPMQLLEQLQAKYGERFEQEKAGAEFDGLANKAMLDDEKSQITSKA